MDRFLETFANKDLSILVQETIAETQGVKRKRHEPAREDKDSTRRLEDEEGNEQGNEEGSKEDGDEDCQEEGQEAEEPEGCWGSATLASVAAVSLEEAPRWLQQVQMEAWLHAVMLEEVSRAQCNMLLM